MKRLLVTVILGFLLINVYGQSVAGSWQGVLNVQGFKLRLVFHIRESDGVFKAAMDSPDQNAFGIPVAEVIVDGSGIELNIPPLMASYKGVLVGDSLLGDFIQAGMKFPLNLSRGVSVGSRLTRPQEPTPPFNYRSEEVRFYNTKAKINLAGTLTMPNGNGPFPAVVLISGSGAQNRDQEIFGHKPFWVLADHLTQRGFAVLRFDDRGTAASEGDFATATSADFATDVHAAVQFLRSVSGIDPGAIGLIGHSEGGIIAPMVAANDPRIAGIVLLAGSGIPGHELLMLQARKLSEAASVPAETIVRTLALNRTIYDKVMESSDPLKLNETLATLLRKELPSVMDDTPGGIDLENFIAGQIAQVTSPWFRYFLTYDPAADLSKVKSPVLALNGLNDLQVPAAENLAAIQKALQRGGNQSVTLMEFPRLNHLFQTSLTGLPAEYAQIEETLSPDMLKAVAQWLEEHLKTK